MIKKIAITVLAASLCMLSVRCIKSDGELGDSTVVINLGLDQAFNAPKTRFDRFMNFIMPKAYAAPSNISSVSVVVSADDIKTFENSYSPPPTYITVTVPAGKSRFIQVIGYVQDGDPSAVLSYRGTLTADLEPGETKEVAMQMVTYETKLVIPDSQNRRIVQMDNMKGAGWTTYSLAGALAYDVDYDARGRIFISKSSSPYVIRLDTINSSPISIVTVAGTSWMAIDRKKNLLYHYRSPEIYSCDLDGGNMSSAYSRTGVETLNTIAGMNIDEDGVLYIAGTTIGAGPTQRVFRYDPIIQRVTHSSGTVSSFNEVTDVIVKGEYVYVSNYDGAGSNDSIVQLTKDLKFIKAYKNPRFYGPHGFVAITNRRFYLIDDSYTSDQMVAFDDLDDGNFEYYGRQGSGVGEFIFYLC